MQGSGAFEAFLVVASVWILLLELILGKSRRAFAPGFRPVCPGRYGVINRFRRLAGTPTYPVARSSVLRRGSGPGTARPLPRAAAARWCSPGYALQSA